VAGSGTRRGLPHSERTVFLGPQAGLAKALAAADAFILPTIYDPFSNACLEALAYGLPVITTKANGFAEIMTETDGTAVDAALQVDALASAIESWSDPARRSVGLAARLVKGRQYSVEKNLQETMSALEQLDSPGAP
jgi:UDP-glucose:(heptosyl)LPS alpha-1,3-glucosyltransferase